jgi:phospholipid/cholesterol/gamma-HCH transport system ATP-binding protein
MLKVENLSKSFNDKVILNNISFQVADGENLVVFGRSGTGKSVLLKCLVRLLEPDSGRIYVQDKDVLSLNIKELNELRKQIGFLFQSAALYDSMTVRHNLEFPLVRNFNFTQKQREEKIISVLEKVSLLDAIDKMPSELSGGMKKRIGLARAIITEPKLMLYDEPTTGLDPITSKEISMLILELQKSLKMTSIIVTHDLLCAKIIADRAIMLNEGKIIFEGSLEKMTLSNNPFLNNFFKHDIINKQEYKNV